MSYLTMDQVRRAWYEESTDLMRATEAQISCLCNELGNDDPSARWEDYQEELRCLLIEARHEFEMGY